jgi:hypothetical protein
MKHSSIKEQAIFYRKQGYSYPVIKEKLNIPIAKSTLGVWLKDIPFVPNKRTIARIQLARQKLILTSQKRGLLIQNFRKDIQRKAKKEITKINEKTLWYLGTILYLAEGGKKQKQVQITNSDPRVIKIAVKWLITICKVSINDITAAIHAYPDTNENKAIKFWTKISNIPKNQFQKTIIDRRVKKSKIKQGTLPYGTLNVRVRKGGTLFAKISGWIEGILEKSI